MSITLLGQAKVANYGDLKIWAERGLIRIENIKTSAYHTITVRETLLRLQGQADMIGNSLDESIEKDWYHLRHAQQGVEDVLAIVEQAKEQGQPSDPGARTELHRRRAITVSVPANKYLF